MPRADLLIIMGTSLTVHPFASLVEMVDPTCPRLLLNMKPVGLRVPDPNDDGLRLRQPENYRDVMIEGTCDDAVRAICDELDWRQELEEHITAFESKVGPSLTPIDWAAAFPKMAPHGIKYNWRAAEDDALELPPPLEPLMRPEEVHIDEIEKLARGNGTDAAFVAFEEYTKLTLGGSIAGLLCLVESAHEDWETTHCLALVPHRADSLSFEVLKNAEVLLEPMHKEGEDSDSAQLSFHQVAFQIPYEDGLDPFYIWYVNNTTGKVTHRWGPFNFDGTTAEDAVDDDDAHELNSALLNGMDEIIASMGDLPAHLREAVAADGAKESSRPLPGSATPPTEPANGREN